jgi:D-3-phosphoglycerate dehydrogenase
LSPRVVDIFAARGIAVDFHPGLPAEELKARIGGYDGLAVRSSTILTWRRRHSAALS